MKCKKKYDDDFLITNGWIYPIVCLCQQNVNKGNNVASANGSMLRNLFMLKGQNVCDETNYVT